MNSISAALTLWKIGFTSVEEVIAWADQEIVNSDVPSQELIDLSLGGPETCFKQAEYVFPSRPINLSYQDEFALRAIFTDLQSEQEAVQFVDWASRRCMGQDLANEIVKLSYLFDHLICDCDDMPAAIALAREKIPSLGAPCYAVAITLLEHVPRLALNRARQTWAAHA